MNVVIFKSNYLGDNVVFVPVVQALRRAFPQWHLSLVTQPGVEELYAADIAREDLFLVHQAEMIAALRRPWRARPWHAWLRSRRPDAILLSCDQSTVAHLLAWMSGARVRLGARFGMPLRRAGLTHAVEWQREWNMAQWHWEMARKFSEVLGGPALAATPPPPDLTHLTHGTARVPGRVVIHPGSKRVMTRWPVERFAELGGRLAARGYEVLWSRVPEADTPLPAGVQVASTPKLSDLVRLLASASLFIGNNSGPMHLANAVGTPMVAVIGPSAFAWDPSWYPERVVAQRLPDLACQPCDRPDLRSEGCLNFAEPLACLRRWSVADIERSCVAQLSRQP
jgi:ADP-heptose:LPS heptosyltransferase